MVNVTPYIEALGESEVLSTQSFGSLLEANAAIEVFVHSIAPALDGVGAWVSFSIEQVEEEVYIPGGYL